MNAPSRRSLLISFHFKWIITVKNFQRLGTGEASPIFAIIKIEATMSKNGGEKTSKLIGNEQRNKYIILN